MKKKKLTGRPPGKSNTRDKIVQNAQKLFANQGYDRTTLRKIAAVSDVDPALLVHYFGTKQKLFVAAMLPLFKAPQMLPVIFESEPAHVGERFGGLIEQFLQDGETPQFLTALIRAASSDPAAAKMVRDFIEPSLIEPLAKKLPHENPQLAASLIGAQMIGIIMAKYIISVPPLASASPAEIKAILSPIIQSYFDSASGRI